MLVLNEQVEFRLDAWLCLRIASGPVGFRQFLLEQCFKFCK